MKTANQLVVESLGEKELQIITLRAQVEYLSNELKKAKDAQPKAEQLTQSTGN